MDVDLESARGLLMRLNPWWGEGPGLELPSFRRSSFASISNWIASPPARRALLLTGPRQVGKTTLLLQVIQRLVGDGAEPTNVLFVTLDHPSFSPHSLDTLLRIWRECCPARGGVEYLFFDEIQVAKDWQPWLKHQVDFEKSRRIAATGSAMPLLAENQESGVGRWRTVHLPPLSFFEYLQIRETNTSPIPPIQSLESLRQWDRAEFSRVAQTAHPLAGWFNEYLIRGGFPQCALVDSVPLAQKLLREDIVDRVLKRDMTSFFGVRRIPELEQLFLYLCLHEGGRLDVTNLAKSLKLTRPTIGNFLSMLESANLIHRIQPFGYGKQVLKGQARVYLADAAISPSVQLRGSDHLQDATALGLSVETAFFRHLHGYYSPRGARLFYWRGKNDHEVDFVVEKGNRLLPFEVKHRPKSATGARALAGMHEFCQRQRIEWGHLISREISDFGVDGSESNDVKLLRIPVALACYWLGQSEFEDE